MGLENEELKRVGLKVTLPRLKILQILEQAADTHMSAEDVYKALHNAGDDVGLATVYRVLTQFESAGLVVRHNFEGYSVFELDQGDHHDHLVCLRCGRVDEFVDDTIEKRQAEVAQQHGFKILNHNLHIYGICQPCQSKKSGE